MNERKLAINGNLIPRREDFLSPFEQHFNKFFEEFWNPKGLDSLKASASFPKINVYEKDGELIMSASISGIKEDDIQIEVTPDNYLVISGKMSGEHRVTEEVVWHIKEIRQSAFERRLKLPNNIEGEPVAELRDGMLIMKWKIKNYNKEITTSKKISISKSLK